MLQTLMPQQWGGDTITPRRRASNFIAGVICNNREPGLVLVGFLIRHYSSTYYSAPAVVCIAAPNNTNIAKIHPAFHIARFLIVVWNIIIRTENGVQTEGDTVVFDSIVGSD